MSLTPYLPLIVFYIIILISTGTLYYGTGMYRSDKLDDMLEHGVISELEWTVYQINDNLDIKNLKTKTYV